MMLRHAYENVPFYHRRFDEAGVKPSDVQWVEDLSKIPLTSKEEVQAAPRDFISGSVDMSKCIHASTSGSTGIPLTVLEDKASADYSGALWARALLENGLKLSDKMAIIKNPAYFPKRKGMLKLLRRKYVSLFDDVERQLEILADYQPDVMRGVTSSMERIAAANKSGGSLIKPRLVFSGAELMNEGYRKEISSSFSCDVLDYYGCVEFGLLAWECREHRGYHLNVEGTVVEFLSGGEAVGIGEEGEVVCTSLGNYAMPLIRYRLGDVAVPSDEACPCGVTLPLMKMVKGRADDFVVTPDGRHIYASPLFYNIYTRMEGIEQFRIVQDRRDKLRIQLVLRKDFPNENQVLEEAKKKIQDFFGENMHIELELLEKIERDPAGKLRMFISNVSR